MSRLLRPLRIYVDIPVVELLEGWRVGLTLLWTSGLSKRLYVQGIRLFENNTKQSMSNGLLYW